MCRRMYLRPINIKLDKWMLAMILYASGNKYTYMTPLTTSHLLLSYHHTVALWMLFAAVWSVVAVDQSVGE